MQMRKTAVVFVCAIVLVGAVSFYGGMKYDQSKNLAARAAGQGAFRAGRTMGQQGQVMNGQVIAKDASSITVKLRDGSSKIVLVSGSAAVSKMAPGSLQDIAIGTDVFVIGSTNSDGSITAQSVQIRPLMPSPQAQ